MSNKSGIKIFMIGMMGAGKSSIGMSLSDLLGYHFLDIDELIGVDSYLNKYSIEQFRLEEINQINQVNQKYGNYVISVGGGAILSDRNRKIINQHTSFFLRASIDCLLSRIAIQKIKRPLIKFNKNGDIDKKNFSNLYNQRESHYLELANFVIDTDHLDILNVAKIIHNKIVSNGVIS